MAVPRGAKAPLWELLVDHADGALAVGWGGLLANGAVVDGMPSWGIAGARSLATLNPVAITRPSRVWLARWARLAQWTWSRSCL